MDEREGTTLAYECCPRTYGQVLREMSEFYAGKGDVYRTLRRLAQRLEQEGIPYAVIGGMALAGHGLVRATQDVDILLTPEGLARFRERLVGRGYRPAFPGAQKSFRDTETGVRIEVVIAGEYPGDGRPKPVAFPDPAKVSVEYQRIRLVSLERLVELKLASGMSAPHRLRDLADVQDLIATLRLPRDFAARLDPSVREKYLELWQAVREQTGPSDIADL